VASVSRRKIAIRHPLLKDGLRRLTVRCDTLRRPVILIPSEPEPLEAFKDRLQRGLGDPPGIGIVDAEDHGPGVVPRLEPVKDESTRTSDVQKASGRRRKTHSKHWSCQ